MKQIHVFIVLFCSFVMYGQISPEKNVPFHKSEFVVYRSFTDSLHNTLYEIGRHEPKNHIYKRNNEGKWEKVKQTIDENFHHVYAPVYLKIQHKETENYYFLDDYYDVDFYRFKKLNSEKLLFIKARYHFHIFDREKRTLSSKAIPGLDQYEGEDAISGLYDALTLFDNEQFLFGNVQSFGVFCFDISNPSQPEELKQYSIKDSNDGQFYAFFHRNNQNLFDVIIVQSDLESKNPNIRSFYKKLAPIKYVLKDVLLQTTSSDQPKIKILKNEILFFSDETIFRLNLREGTIYKKVN